VEKAMRASAAAVYWRTVDAINRQRLGMTARLEPVHQTQQVRSFSQARRRAPAERIQREAVVSAQYALLEGHPRFARLPQPTARRVQPLHRDRASFPSPDALLQQLGVRGWFAPLHSRAETDPAKHYCVAKEALTLPTLALQVVDRRAVGKRVVFDLAVDGLHAFVAGTGGGPHPIGQPGPPPAPIYQRGQKRQRSRRRRRPLRQSQLRGAHPPPGTRQLPRLAPAGGSLRPGRLGGY